MGHDVVVEATALDISLGGMLVDVREALAAEEGAVLDVALPWEIGWVAGRVVRIIEQREHGARKCWGIELGEMPPSMGADWARHVFTEAKRLGYHEQTEAWRKRTPSSSLVCPTCGNLMDTGVAPERLLTAAGLAEHLDIRVGQIYRMARAGRLPCYRIGRRLRFDVVEVHASLRSEGPPR